MGQAKSQQPRAMPMPMPQLPSWLQQVQTHDVAEAKAKARAKPSRSLSPPQSFPS